MATPDSPAVAPKTSNINVRRGEPLVVIDHVDKHFGDLHVLRDINTVVNRGEVVVVIGPSGSGKSTLCRAINRLETIDSGTITIDGVPLPEEGKGLATLRADVGMVFQSFNLFAHKTVLENVTLGPIRVRKMSRKAADRVLFMADGAIVEEATPEQFFTNPQSERAKDFLSKILEH